MRKRGSHKKLNLFQAFNDFLFRRVEELDAQILKDTAMFVNPIRRDIRFLPNSLRGLYSMCHYRNFSFRKCSKITGLSRSSVSRKYHKAEGIIKKRLDEWISSLPKERADIERNMRRGAWIGQVSTGKFKPFGHHTYEEFEIPLPKYESHDWIPCAPGFTTKSPRYSQGLTT